MVLCDGERALPLATSKDYKKVFDGDRGPNTGGMGSHSPSVLLDASTGADVLTYIVHPTLKATFNQRELGHDFNNYPNGLRAALRQAPKVILVGEMRDRATVEVALMAAETGHLVLSTLHTNDAPSAITRLTDMGVEGYLITSSLVGVLDLGDPEVEAPALVADRIRAALEYVPAERLAVGPDCGMKYLPREVAQAKLRALVEGARIVRSELGVTR